MVGEGCSRRAWGHKMYWCPHTSTREWCVGTGVRGWCEGQVWRDRCGETGVEELGEELV